LKEENNKLIENFKEVKEILNPKTNTKIDSNSNSSIENQQDMLMSDTNKKKIDTLTLKRKHSDTKSTKGKDNERKESSDNTEDVQQTYSNPHSFVSQLNTIFNIFVEESNNQNQNKDSQLIFEFIITLLNYKFTLARTFERQQKIIELYSQVSQYLKENIKSKIKN